MNSLEFLGITFPNKDTESKMAKNLTPSVILAIALGLGLALLYIVLSFQTTAQFCNFRKAAVNFIESNYQSVRDIFVAENKTTKDKFGEIWHDEEEVEAAKWAKEVRVLCWILTGPKNHKRRAIHVKRTWGKRCNKLLFMSSKADEELGSIALPNIIEGYDFLWGKTKAAFKYIYEHHFHEADWFMKADDDTYVIVENLRYLLKDYNASSPLFFGCKMSRVQKEGYMTGGSGYVLSKEAVRRFVKEAIPNEKKCLKGQGHKKNEDFEISKCLAKVGVEFIGGVDAYGRNRFQHFPVEQFIVPGRPKGIEFWDWMTYQPKDGFECCSDTTISFHHIESNQMYLFDFLLYHVRPYGVGRNRTTSPAT